MEPSRFDELTKALATATSRRHALKALAATVGGVLGFGSIGIAFANCKPNGIGCNIGYQCCSGACCHGTCTDLSSNPNNCGSCGHTCGTGQLCQNGQCVNPCAANGGTCNGNSDCCSGHCENNQCVCPSGCIVLANGTCAQTCTGVPDSCTCNGTCGGDSSSPTGGLCGSTLTINATCTSDRDCPPGYACNTNGGPPAHCFLACC